MALREQVHNNEDSRLKSSRYLFFFTGAEQGYMINASCKSRKWFFVKPNSLE
jgi:hypothetical protein